MVELRWPPRPRYPGRRRGLLALVGVAWLLALAAVAWLLAPGLAWLLAPGLAWAQQIPAAGCAAALASEGLTIDGLPMEPWTWGGDAQDLGTLDGHRVVLCQANGPRDRLPLQNAIGCVMIDDQPARVGDRLVCGAYLTVERPGDTLLWTAHASAATVEVTPLRWNGDRFAADASFIACADFPLRPVQDPQQACTGPPR